MRCTWRLPLIKCDFIVSWNCRHLANPNKFAHIQRVNVALGLHIPEIATPLDLLRRGNEG